MPSSVAPRADAAALVAALVDRGLTFGCAESLTGGLVGAAITSVPGASAVFRGGVVAYATEVKSSVLGVPASLLEERGPVDPDVALAMAVGVRRLIEAAVAVATTGVAGPDRQGARDVGTVFVAVAGGCEHAGWVEEHRFGGGRAEIREATVDAVLRLALAWVQEHAACPTAL